MLEPVSRARFSIRDLLLVVSCIALAVYCLAYPSDTIRCALHGVMMAIVIMLVVIVSCFPQSRIPTAAAGVAMGLHQLFAVDVFNAVNDPQMYPVTVLGSVLWRRIATTASSSFAGGWSWLEPSEDCYADICITCTSLAIGAVVCLMVSRVRRAERSL